MIKRIENSLPRTAQRAGDAQPEDTDHDLFPGKCDCSSCVALCPDPASKVCIQPVQNKYLPSSAHTISNRLHELIIHEVGEFGIDPRLCNV